MRQMRLVPRHPCLKRRGDDSEDDPNELSHALVVPLEDRNDYLDVEGKMVHKASVVRGIFHRGIMSTDRLQRVRGFGRFQAGQGQAIDRAAQEVLMLSDLVACLVQLPGNKGKTVAVEASTESQ